MRKNALFLFFLVFLVVGCANGKERLGMYIENPQYLIKDKEFETYKGQFDALEKQYLNKEITYAEYIEKKKNLEGEYDRKIQKREAIIKSE